MSKQNCTSNKCNCLSPYESKAPCNDHDNFTCYRYNRFKDITGLPPYNKYPPNQSNFYKVFEKSKIISKECPTSIPTTHHPSRHPRHSRQDDDAAYALDSSDIIPIDMYNYIQM